MTDVTLLLGLSGRRFCILLLTITVTTHERSPFSFGLGKFSPLQQALRTLARRPPLFGRLGVFIDNSYFIVIVTLHEKARARSTFFPGEEIFPQRGEFHGNIVAPGPLRLL
jgi:hypothetical protein